MKSFAVVLIVSMSLCGFFPQSASGLSCYECKWTDSKCASETDEEKLTKVECKPKRSVFLQRLQDATADPAAPADPADPAAPADPAVPGGSPGVVPTLPPAGPSDGKYYCFKLTIKDGSTTAVERGCKPTKEITDCPFDKAAHPDAAADGDCVVCDKDNCNGNGQSMVTGSVVQCALVAAMVVARMIFHTK